MNTKSITLLSVILIISCLPSCVSTQKAFQATNQVSEVNYQNENKAKGTVLMAINWGRQWNCGGYENAELRNIGFDLMPSQNINSDQPPSLVVNGPSRLTVKPEFTNYAFLVEPGEYALSYVNIKAARSVSNVGYFTIKRSDLIKNGESRGGTFRVDPGEVVYIGNFWLDCAYGPMLWRYYTEGLEKFKKHLQEYSNQFPFVDLSNVQYRLLETKEFGVDYQLK